MSLQTIIGISDQITIDRRKVVGIQYTRSEIARVSETPTRNPWRFELNPTASLVYSESRGILEELDRLDRRLPETISFSYNPKLSWMFRYQGDLIQSQLDSIRVGSFANSGNFLSLTGFGNVAQTAVIFRAGDILQIVGYPYPFTITQTYTGANVSGGILTVTTHRPNFITANLAGLALNFGSNVQFRMFCNNMPTYSLVPGATRYDSNGVLINNARIQFDDSFMLYEWTGEA